ncbi:hypothetical protein MBCUT_12180 [Methanobrevibacter cuticularis]|uniref:Uncharacterized protein n=1 Tax=Methanobrevibacter cuticularis TaxID=47311 RepID=A0A166DS38_9EURY|nr:hypothetical protein [Methanobrevibacter cuticularis]KZX15893.1 hypothetical protein MBCUT_12180 [Methanobrevibacter cuticularis]
MKRDPIKQYFKDPDKKAKLFFFSTIAMITSTILITVGTILFILILVGII